MRFQTRLTCLMTCAGLILSGCATKPATSNQYLAVSLKAETTPTASNYRTYFLGGGGLIDFQSIPGQKLKPKVISALAAKGFVEAVNPRDADLIIQVYAAFQVTKTTGTYSTPNSIYVPGSVSSATSISQTPSGLIPTQTTVTTPGRTIYAGTTEHSFDRYGVNGLVTLTASAWREWTSTGAAQGTRARVVWEASANYFGDPPGGDTTEKCLDWALRHAGTDFNWSKLYRRPQDFLELELP